MENPAQFWVEINICQSLEDVAEKIEQLKAMVRAGELDPQIEAASEAIRTRFKKSK